MDFLHAFVQHLEEQHFFKEYIEKPHHSLLIEFRKTLQAFVDKYASNTSLPTDDKTQAQKEALKLVWDNTPEIQEKYIRKVLGDDYETASETMKRVAKIRAFQLFVEEMIGRQKD
jgi:hypothetical protein